jgi:hypothetical protein
VQRPTVVPAKHDCFRVGRGVKTSRNEHRKHAQFSTCSSTVGSLAHSQRTRASTQESSGAPCWTLESCQRERACPPFHQASALRALRPRLSRERSLSHIDEPAAVAVRQGLSCFAGLHAEWLHRLVPLATIRSLVLSGESFSECGGIECK